MTSFMFLILKMNVIAALIICATVWIGHFTKGKYSSKWKYYMWLIVMVFGRRELPGGNASGFGGFFHAKSGKCGAVSVQGKRTWAGFFPAWGK